MISLFLSPLGAQKPDKLDVNRVFLDFNNAHLVYTPGTKVLRVTAQDNVISDGSDLEICQVKPFLYHLRHKDWDGFYWKVNTGQKRVYKVTEGTFCQVGGRVHRRNITVEVQGGSPVTPPDRFVLGFSKANLVYIPGPGTLQITAQDSVLSCGKDWQKCNLNSNTFHLKQDSWKGFYWKVLTRDTIAHRVTSRAGFCSGGNFPMERLNVGIRSVK